jgi:hypothetical protein
VSTDANDRRGNDDAGGNLNCQLQEFIPNASMALRPCSLHIEEYLASL